MVACLIAIGLGRLSPLTNSAARFGLELCSGQPCFRGLIAGRTSWAAAQYVFGNRTTILLDPPNGAIRVYPSLDHKTLGRIAIQVPADGSLSAGDAVSLLGPPCGVTINPQSYTYTLRYLTVRFVTQNRQDILNVNTPVVFIEFSDPSYTRNAGASPCVAQPTTPELYIVNRPWRGFIATQHYLHVTHHQAEQE
jgi:hypothetical protein